METCSFAIGRHNTLLMYGGSVVAGGEGIGSSLITSVIPMTIGI